MSPLNTISRLFTIPRFLFVLSLPFLAGGGMWMENEISFQVNGQLVDGTVEEILTRRTKKGRTLYVISYEDPQGKTVRFRSRYEPRKWIDPATATLLDEIFPEPPMGNGDRVILRADWRNDRVRVEKWIFWVPPTFLLVPGVLLSALAWYTRGRGLEHRQARRSTRIKLA